MSYVLGIDLSTQSLSALALDAESGQSAVETAISFGVDLPEFSSPSGVLEGKGQAERHADPLMWAEGLDLLFERMRQQGFDFSQVVALSGAAQQHGSVYLKSPWQKDGGAGDKSLGQQLRPLLSRKTAPLWMDNSAQAAARQFAERAGGDSEVRRRSGSGPEARFAAAQIRKLSRGESASYKETRRIHLVSSLLSSFLMGQDAPMDYADALGMNLVHLGTRDWDQVLLDASADSLRERLPQIVESSTQIGTVSSYLQSRYGFGAGVAVYSCTGDNPSSLVGTGAGRPGDVVVSLGTSDTVMAPLSGLEPDKLNFGHVFGNPLGGHMALICFSNGSLAREKVLSTMDGSWSLFEKAVLEETQPGSGGNRMLPYFFPEITPLLAKPGPWLTGSDDFLAWRDTKNAARAVVEAQATLMRHYSRPLLNQPLRLILTGGAAKNLGIQRVFADVFQAEVVVAKSTGSVARGAALRARLHWREAKLGAFSSTARSESYEELSALSECQNTLTKPEPAARLVYERLESELCSDLSSVLHRQMDGEVTQ